MTISYDLIEDNVVSRQHAVIKVRSKEPPRFTISDLRSTNGTFLNGRPVTDESELHPGDVVELGRGGPKFRFDLDRQLTGRAEGAATPRRGVAPDDAAVPGGDRPHPIPTPDPISAPAAAPPAANGRRFKIPALIFGVLGTLSVLTLAVYAYAAASFFVAIGGGGYAAALQFLSIMLPIACIVGTGILWTAPGFGGATLLGCAVVILLIAGFNFVSMTAILLLAAGGGFALASAAADQKADPARRRQQGR